MPALAVGAARGTGARRGGRSWCQRWHTGRLERDGKDWCRRLQSGLHMPHLREIVGQGQRWHTQWVSAQAHRVGYEIFDVSACAKRVSNAGFSVRGLAGFVAEVTLPTTPRPVILHSVRKDVGLWLTGVPWLGDEGMFGHRPRQCCNMEWYASPRA